MTKTRLPGAVSTSVPLTTTLSAAPSSSIVTLAGLAAAVGASLTGFTVMETLASALLAAPSLAQQSKLAEPLKFRSEEHRSELQSRQYLVCRLLLDKKTQ